MSITLSSGTFPSKPQPKADWTETWTFRPASTAFLAVATGTALIFLRQTFEPWFSVKLAFVAGLGLAISGPDLASLIGMPGTTVRGIGLLALAAVAAVLLFASLRRGSVTVFGRAVALPD